MTPESALHQLLLSLFAADELRRWLRYDPTLSPIVDELPGPTAAPAALVSAVVERLTQRGLVEAELFARLREERPRRSAEIDRVEALWRDPQTHSPSAPAAPSSPPRPTTTATTTTRAEPPTTSDVALLIALKEEWQVVWELAGKPRGLKDAESGRVLFRFEVPSESGRAYRCVGLFIGEMGPGQAANAAAPLLRGRPRTLVNVGIAAAIHDDLRLCDVVVADQVDDYLATVKAASEGESGWRFEVRGSVYKTTHSLVQDVDTLEYADHEAFTSWQAVCATAAAERPEFAAAMTRAIGAKIVREAPAIARVHLASGPVLAAAEAFSRWIRGRDQLLKALEMEAAGMMLAAHHQGEPTPTLVLRGISDFGDSRKSQTDKESGGAFRRAAMMNATQLLWTLMRRGLLPRHDDAARR